MSEFKSGIYKITINDYYVYIGQSVDVKRRWSTHLNELKQNKKSYNKKFQNIFNKYPDKVRFEIIELCDADKLGEREMYWIDCCKSYNTKHGLNLSIGGDGGCRKYKTKEEVRVAILKSRKKYYNTHISTFKQQYIVNKSKHKEYNKQWCQNNRDYFKNYWQNNKDVIREKSKEYNKQWRQNNKEKINQWYQDNKDKCKERYQNIKKQKGILSHSERSKINFEKRYNLSRPLTNEEWDIWINTKNKGKFYTIKYLKTLPNITFTIPSKK